MAAAIVTAATLVGPTLDRYRTPERVEYDTTGLSSACVAEPKHCTSEDRIRFAQQNSALLQHVRTLHGVYWADSDKYMRYSEGNFSLSGLMSFSYNALGPALLAFVTKGNTLLISSINCIVLALTVIAVFHYLPVNPLIYVLCILLNPMLFFSLPTVNKEILALSSFVLAAIFLERGGWQYCILSLGLAALGRWPQCIFLVGFFGLCWITRRLSRPPQFMYAWLALALVLSSIAFPSVRHLPAVNGYFSMDWAEYQTHRGHGVLGVLNTLQDDHWYGLLIAIGPKALLQWSGNIFRIGATLSGQGTGLNYKDVYSTYVTLGHQLWMTAVLIVLFVARRLDWRSYTTQLIIWYTAFMASLPVINYRLMFPLVGLLAIHLARTRSRAETVMEGELPLRRVPAPLEFSPPR